MTFGQIQTKVREYLNRTDLDSLVPDFINMAMRRIENTYSFKYMERYVTTQTNEDRITMPERYKDTKVLWIENNGYKHKLVKTSMQALIDMFPQGFFGRPTHYATLFSSNEIFVRPIPNEEYTYELLYHCYSLDLVDNSDANYLTDRQWELLLYGALLEAEPYLMNDARITTWANLFKEGLEHFRRTDANEEFAGYLNIGG